MLRLLLIFILCITSQAASYYVDFSTGNDANDGSISTPFKHCPGDTNATGIASSTTLSAGDTVYFASQSTYIVSLGSVVLSWSGSVGSPITYDGSTWGTGTNALITNTNHPSGGAGFKATVAKNYLSFKGFIFKDIGGIADDNSIWTDPIYQYESNKLTSVPAGTGISFAAGGQGIVITNCYFVEIGQWIPEKPVDGGDQITGAGIALNDNTNVIVTGCEFTKMKQCVSVKASVNISDITITNCNLHNYLHWPIDIAPKADGAVISNITIIDTLIHDFTEYDSGNWNGWGEKPHTDGVFIRASQTTSSWYNVVIDRCYFYADDRKQSAGGTSAIYISGGPSATIRNCVFSGSPYSDAQLTSGGEQSYNTATQKIYIFNNTFFCSSRSIYLSDITGTNVQLWIANNIMRRVTSVANNSIAAILDWNTVQVLDYNIYYSDNFSEAAQTAVYDGTWRNLASVKSLGYEAHGFWANPIFIDATHSVTNQASLNNLHLLSISSSINSGTNLSSIFTYDKDKVIRETLWDIGAYEFINEPVHNGSANTIRANTMRVFGP